MCTELADPLAALDIAERIRRALSGRLRVNQLDLAFGVSIGVAMSDADLLDLTEDDAAAALISNADTAMYEAKKSGRARRRALHRRRCALPPAIAPNWPPPWRMPSPSASSTSSTSPSCQR